MNTLLDWGDGLYAVDSGYLRPRLAAVHFIVDRGRVALVDTGTAASLPRIEAALAALGLDWTAVDYVFLSHIHLDHAGGAGVLMQRCPQAQLVVHERGARHMAEPQKLWAGVVAVYGAERTAELYGQPQAIDPARILACAEDTVLRLGSRELLVFDAPGHARHHLGLLDRYTGGVFTGDAFGLSYRELDRDGLAFAFPTTTPVQFDPEAMHATIDRIVSFRPPAVYPTHFSRIDDVPRLADDLHRLIDAHVERARAVGGQGYERLRAALDELLLAEAERQRWPIGHEDLRTLFALDLDLNSQGLLHWLNTATASQ